MLYSGARVLLDEASSLERAAQRNSAGWEAEITIAVEIIFPTWLLLKCLDRFGREAPNTRIEVIETVLGGAPEALFEHRVDLALTPRVPPGLSGESLVKVLVDLGVPLPQLNPPTVETTATLAKVPEKKGTGHS